MSGFWKFTSNYASKVSKILENENIILEDLLDERETVSELLASNARLIEYLRRPEILEKLVDYVVNDDEYQRRAIESEFDNVNESITVDINNEINDQDIKNSNTNVNASSIINKLPLNEKENDNSQRNKPNQVNGKTANGNSSLVEDNINKLSSKIVDEDKCIGQESDDELNEEIEKNNDEEQENNSDESDESADDTCDSDNDIDHEDSEHEDESEDEKHNRRAQVAAEILSIDVWSITDTFMESTELLEKLWCILDKPAPLPIFSATYFMKINEHLLDMKTDEMIQFIHQEQNLVERFMRHIETPPLMDFLLKVISTDKPDDSTGIIDVLKEQGLIQSLINFLSNDIPSSIQSAAGDFLKAFITISANNAENTTIGPNELTRELVSEPMIRLLVDKMLQGGTGLSNGVGIVIEIIRKNNSDYDPVPVVYVTVESHPPTPRDPIYLGTLVKVFAEKLPEFTKLLEQKVDKTLPTPFGTIEPLGFERFKICELVAELIHCSNMALLNDQKGEALVKERDEIREFLIEKHKEILKRVETDSTASLDGADISNEIENLRLSKQRDENKTKESELLDENDENNIDELDDEQSLRRNPVVGDQLKIALYDNKIIVIIIDMFFKFPWNNFLHNVVFDIVQQILNATMEIGYNKYLAVDLFDRCNIAKAIVNGHNNCTEYEEKTGLRLGYMGHLSLIAEEVVKFISLEIHNTTTKSKIIDEAVENDEWKQYVDETLTDIRNKYNAVLGSDGKQMNEHDLNLFQRVYGSGEYDDEEEGEEEDEEDVVLEGNNDNGNGYMDSEENELDSDKFSRYIGEEITGDLPDRFGSSDEESEDDDVRQRKNQLWSDDNAHEHTTDELDGIVDSKMGGNPYHEMSAGGLDDENINIDDEFDDNDVDDVDFDHDDSRYISNEDYGDYDDYEDPNDDGKSYTKSNHPLYQADGSLRSLSSEKFSDSSSSD
jgi:SIT4-associating protein SAP185/190